MCAAHAMADSDDGPRHFLALDIDQVQKVSGVIEPACCLSPSGQFSDLARWA